MRQDIYQNGIRYAKSLIRYHNSVYGARDLAHDAYIKCKGDENWFIRTILLTHKTYLKSKYTSIGGKTGKNGYEGEKIVRQWLPVNPTGADEDRSDNNSLEIPCSAECTIDYQSFINSTPKFDRNVLLLRLAGYEYAEIAKKLKCNYSYVSAVLRLKEKAKQVL